MRMRTASRKRLLYDRRRPMINSEVLRRKNKMTIGGRVLSYLAIAMIALEYPTHGGAVLARGKDTNPHRTSWAVEIAGGRSKADRIARQYGFENLGQVGELDDVYHFKLDDEAEERKDADGHSVSQNLAKNKEVKFFEKQVPQGLVLRYYETPKDPLFVEQWNLLNTGQDGGKYTGNDLRVEQAWLQGLTGCNVTVSVVDDGIDYKHPDLWPNFVPDISYDHVQGDPNPSSYQYHHGTSCSGIIAGAQDDKTCGVGIAHECNLGSLKLLDRKHLPFDLEVAEALTNSWDIVDIYSNSWGPTDNGSFVKGPGYLTSRVFQEGTKTRRGGKGSIYVWANGNGGRDGDDCGADGFVSSIYTISVGAIGVDGRSSPIEEICSAKMVVSYVTDSSNESAIRTTEIGGECTKTFGGTSAAAPMVTGIIALALEVNPSLTWRDVQYLIVYTANPDLTAGIQTRNGAGLVVSRRYGFGVMDAEAMVSRARHWISVPPQIEDETSEVYWAQTSSAPYTARANYTGNIHYLEHVVVRMDVEVPKNSDNLIRGSLKIELTSPSKTNSVLLDHRVNDNKPGGYFNWPFMSVMFWGENPTGEWSLTVKTGDKFGVANVTNVSFIFYGVSSVPEAVRNIPEQCHADCKRGCAGNTSDHCDSCRQLRDAHTLACINNTTCTAGYTEHNGYCYNASLPFEECYAPLKNKDNTDFDPHYNNITCAEVGYTECCANGYCTSLHPIQCFCDEHCFKFHDCCDNVTEIGCLEQDREAFPYIELENTSGIETNNIGSQTDISSPINASFPFVSSVEPTIYISRNGYFRFASSESQEGRQVNPFFSRNEPHLGSVEYEIHERDNRSQKIWSTVDSILSEHGYSDFSGEWLLVSTWSNVVLPDYDGNYTNTFQGILVTDQLKSYAIFTYYCGDMSFSSPGVIGYSYSDIDLNVEHGATFRHLSHYISCYNYPRSSSANVVYEIATSENQCEIENGGCEYNCTDTFSSFYCTCEPGYVLNDDQRTCSDIDECLGLDHGCEEQCMNTNGSYYCYCSEGFEIEDNGRSCRDVDECMEDLNVCEQVCVNNAGSYMCKCNEGYLLNRTNFHTCVELSLLELKESEVPLGKVPKVDDGLSEPIRLPNGFPFGKGCESTIYVGTNGYFTFSRFSGFTPFPFSLGNGLSIVAPFFTDIDISNQNGSISYQVHHNLSNPFSSEVAETINDIIHVYKTVNFSAQWVLVATWNKVTPYGRYDRNFTFQGILATDFRKSYAIFLYECDGESRGVSNHATIGFVTKDGLFENHNLTYQRSPFMSLCNGSRTTKIIHYEITGCKHCKRSCPTL